MTNEKRKIVIPGETIVVGGDFLPGENTEKKGDEIIATKFGLAEEQGNLVKVIALSGVYTPRRGNVVIGTVSNLTFNGWVVDIGMAENAFIPLTEVPRFVNKNAIDEVMDFGDLVVAKIIESRGRGIDMTLRSRGLGKIEDGMIIKVNPNKVPRIIGKEGSMVTLIKEKTGCNITVGQNGRVWLKGNTIEEELYAKKAIMFVADNSYISGLTDAVNKWFEENKK